MIYLKIYLSSFSLPTHDLNLNPLKKNKSNHKNEKSFYKRNQYMTVFNKSGLNFKNALFSTIVNVLFPKFTVFFPKFDLLLSCNY